MTITTWRSTAIFLPLLALVLAGCWESASGPLIPREKRSQPLASGTYQYHGDDSVQDVILTRLHGGGYAWEDTVEDGVVIVLAQEIRPDWYVLQMQGNPDDNLFGIAHVEANILKIFDPDCDDEIATIEGVERPKGDCLFSTPESLVMAASVIVDRLEKAQSPEATGWLELDGS